MSTPRAASGTGVSVDQLLALRGVGGGETPQWGIETPRWSSGGSQLMFASLLGGTLELWSVAPASGALTQLTVGMGGVGHLASSMPQWSPTGEYIAYVSAKSGADEVWLWASDGGADRQLTRLGARIEALSWTPDGRALAVASNSTGTFDYLPDRGAGRRRDAVDARPAVRGLSVVHAGRADLVRAVERGVDRPRRGADARRRDAAAGGAAGHRFLRLPLRQDVRRAEGVAGRADVSVPLAPERVDQRLGGARRGRGRRGRSRPRRRIRARPRGRPTGARSRTRRTTTGPWTCGSSRARGGRPGCSSRRRWGCARARRGRRTGRS